MQFYYLFWQWDLALALSNENITAVHESFNLARSYTSTSLHSAQTDQDIHENITMGTIVYVKV